MTSEEYSSTCSIHGIKNHLQAEELASAMKTVAFYKNTSPLLGSISVHPSPAPGYVYTVHFRREGRAYPCRSHVVDETQLHAELFRIITEHYMEV